MDQKISVGDIVGRKSYGKDIMFRVVAIDESTQKTILKGLEWRLVADAPLDDLELIQEGEIEAMRWRRQQEGQLRIELIHQRRQAGNKTVRDGERSGFFEIPGRVVHLDGDKEYLQLCLDFYQKLGIPATGIFMQEKKMPEKVVPLLREYPAEILVITGHDSYKSSSQDPANLANYRNSAYFVEAVQNVRRFYERNRDSLIIFAGACQSNFEAIMKAGANFASSPERVNIHAFDPVYVAERAAFTSIRDTISLLEMVEHTKAKQAGIGGIDSLGTFRFGFPVIKPRKWLAPSES